MREREQEQEREREQEQEREQEREREREREQEREQERAMVLEPEREQDKMKLIAIALFLSGCATVSYWEKDQSAVVFDDEDIHIVRVRSSDYFANCKWYPQHTLACAVRCGIITPGHHYPACRTGFAGLPDRWRCVIVSTYSREQLEMMRGRDGMLVIPHEVKHCKGWNHGY